MSAPLTAAQVASRLIDFPLDRYLYVGSIMRGIALGMGSLVLLEIFKDMKKYGPRILPWLGSLAATILTLVSWGRGALLTNSNANAGDLIFPLAMGIIEFLLFAILNPSKEENLNNNDSNEFRVLYNWMRLFTIHSLFACVLVWNRISQTNPQRDFSRNLQPLANNYMTWMYSDRTGALGCAILFLFLSLSIKIIVNKTKHQTQKIGIGKRWLVFFFALVPIIAYGQAAYQSEFQRQQVDNFVARTNSSKTVLKRLEIPKSKFKHHSVSYRHHK